MYRSMSMDCVHWDRRRRKDAPRRILPQLDAQLLQGVRPDIDESCGGFLDHPHIAREVYMLAASICDAAITAGDQAMFQDTLHVLRLGAMDQQWGKILVARNIGEGFLFLNHGPMDDGCTMSVHGTHPTALQLEAGMFLPCYGCQFFGIGLETAHVRVLCEAVHRNEAFGGTLELLQLMPQQF